MTHPTDPSGATQALAAETEAAFDWLIEPLDRNAPATFVPNPGNVGDAMINLACWRYLQPRFTDLRIASVDETPATGAVLIGGGGNLVERYYRRMADFVARLPERCQVFAFPSTVDGFDALLSRSAPRLRIICREAVSYRHVRSLLPHDRVRLGHDAAFTLAPWLATVFAARLDQRPRAAASLFRRDVERAVSLAGGLDIMGRYGSEWIDLGFAESAVKLAATFMLGFSRIDTDRLHGAILAALLRRETVLLPNTYYKNQAVFDHSLSRLPNVSFNADPTNGNLR